MEPCLAFLDAIGALVEGLAALGEILFGILDLACFVADVYSWIRGRDNRTARREARKAGTDVPPRDVWNRRVVVLTVLVGVITVVWLFAR